MLIHYDLLKDLQKWAKFHMMGVWFVCTGEICIIPFLCSPSILTKRSSQYLFCCNMKTTKSCRDIRRHWERKMTKVLMLVIKMIFMKQNLLNVEWKSNYTHLSGIDNLQHLKNLFLHLVQLPNFEISISTFRSDVVLIPFVILPTLQQTMKETCHKWNKSN
jgi:hypothetical protein